MATREERRHFTVAEYERLTEAGILGEDDRVELIGGEVVRMAAMGRLHAGCITRLDNLLHRQIGDAGLIRVQLPVVIPEYDEPEPDVAVVRPREDYYDGGHPTPGDVLLAIEVADTSLAYDRGVKLPLYARAGIPETWLVNLVDNVLEQHTEPSSEGYRRVRSFRRGDTVESVSVPGLAVPVDDVLGRGER